METTPLDIKRPTRRVLHESLTFQLYWWGLSTTRNEYSQSQQIGINERSQHQSFTRKEPFLLNAGHPSCILYNKLNYTTYFILICNTFEMLLHRSQLSNECLNTISSWSDIQKWQTKIKIAVFATLMKKTNKTNTTLDKIDTRASQSELIQV